MIKFKTFKHLKFNQNSKLVIKIMPVKKSIPIIIVLILFSCFTIGFFNFEMIKEINKNIKRV